MRRSGRVLLLLTVGLVAWPIACEPSAPQVPSDLPKTIEDCAPGGQLAAVAAQPPDSAHDPVIIRVKADLTALFALRGLCVRVDRRAVYVRSIEAPTAIRSEIDLPTTLQKDAPHVVDVLATYDGTGSFAGYKFAVRSQHRISADDLRSGMVLMHIHEKGTPKTPIEERPTIAWTAVPAPAPAPAPAPTTTTTEPTTTPTPPPTAEDAGTSP